jgi:hypothetical protein
VRRAVIAGAVLRDRRDVAVAHTPRIAVG